MCSQSWRISYTPESGYLIVHHKIFLKPKGRIKKSKAAPAITDHFLLLSVFAVVHVVSGSVAAFGFGGRPMHRHGLVLFVIIVTNKNYWRSQHNVTDKQSEHVYYLSLVLCVCPSHLRNAVAAWRGVSCEHSDGIEYGRDYNERVLTICGRAGVVGVSALATAA